MSVEWNALYPQISQCITSTRTLVAKLKGFQNCELEARFGSIQSGKFQPGVARQVMDDIIESMQKSPFVQGDDAWKEENDFYYEYDGKQLRTRVSYDNDSMQVVPETTEKVLVAQSVTLRHALEDGGESDMNVRISLKTESPVSKVPNSIKPNLVRIKQRKRFTTENNAWAFDFSMTWSGASKSEAEYSQMKHEPLFEIECELVDEDYLINRTDDYVAASILLKMHDLMPVGSVLLPI